MKRKLRTGFTTGTAAAAAVKGALKTIIEEKAPDKVKIRLLTGDFLNIPLHSCQKEGENSAVCTVIKDAGDDPDVTHKAEIGARVSMLGKKQKDSSHLIIKGGIGVGVVTKPGLEIEPGQAAINPGPREMIRYSVNDVLNQNKENKVVEVELFVPDGKAIAEKTLNARLGIIGGISILGTTGIVKPMSHEAYTATITSAMSVARALGNKQVILTTGRRSERHIQNVYKKYPEEIFIQIGDYFRMSLETALDFGFEKITMGVFFGKALKMAQGNPHTHAAKSNVSLSVLGKWALAETGDKNFSKKISTANTARHAFELIIKDYPVLISVVGKKMIDSGKKYAAKPIIQGIIFDFNGKIVFNSER